MSVLFVFKNRLAVSSWNSITELTSKSGRMGAEDVHSSNSELMNYSSKEFVRRSWVLAVSLCFGNR